jgi:hypothetical protein
MSTTGDGALSAWPDPIRRGHHPIQTPADTEDTMNRILLPLLAMIVAACDVPESPAAEVKEVVHVVKSGEDAGTVGKEAGDVVDAIGREAGDAVENTIDKAAEKRKKSTD